MANKTNKQEIKDSLKWAMHQFNGCNLGDTRRAKWLIEDAARQAEVPEASTNSVCSGDDAFAEGTYRWLRNEAVSADAVIEAPIGVTLEESKTRPLVLAIQDTSTFVFYHAVADELGKVSSVGGNSVRGVLVHSTLMVDANTREPIGLGDLRQWTRSDEEIKANHKQRKYEDKESIKWEQATKRLRERYGNTPNIVTVCDREADIYEYLT